MNSAPPVVRSAAVKSPPWALRMRRAIASPQSRAAGLSVARGFGSVERIKDGGGFRSYGPRSFTRGPVGQIRCAYKPIDSRCRPAGCQGLREPARRLQTRLRRLWRLVGLDSKETGGRSGEDHYETRQNTARIARTVGESVRAGVKCGRYLPKASTAARPPTKTAFDGSFLGLDGCGRCGRWFVHSRGVPSMRRLP